MHIKLLRSYNYIKKCEKLDPGDLKAINFNRARDLAIYAFDNVDYYRKLYEKNNFDPYRLSVIDDLADLPVAEKKHYRDAPVEKRTSKEFQKKDIVEMSTTGSTAQPMKFFSNRYELSQQILKWMYTFRKYGYKPTDNLVQIFRPLKSVNKSFIQKLGLFRREFVSTYDSIDTIVDRLKSTNVDIVMG